MLGAVEGSVGPDTALSSLGLDSLMLIELQMQLNETVGTDLSLMGLLGIDTVVDAARRMDARMTDDRSTTRGAD